MARIGLLKSLIAIGCFSLNILEQGVSFAKTEENHINQRANSDIEFSLKRNYFDNKNKEKNLLESIVEDEFSFYFNQKLNRKFVEEAHVYFYRKRDFENYAKNFQNAFVYATIEVLEKHPTYLYLREVGEDVFYFLDKEIFLPVEKIAFRPINFLFGNGKNKNGKNKEDFLIDFNADANTIFEGVEPNRNYKTEIILGSNPALKFRFGPNLSAKTSLEYSKISYEQALTKDSFLEAGVRFNYDNAEKPNLFLFIEKSSSLFKINSLSWRLGVQQEFIPKREKYESLIGFSLDFKY